MPYAFGPSGAGPAGRPTAAEWAGLLDRAEADLVRCGQSSARHYFRTAPDCPWCRMERAYPGFLAFVPTVAPTPRYTTLLRAVELWGAVRADGPGRLAGDEELPPVNGLVVCREEDFSQQIKANPEDRLSAAFVGLDDDRPVFRLPFTGRVGERKGYGQHSEKLADPVGVNEVGILEIEAPRLGGREERFDRPPPPVMGQGDLGIGVGGDYKQVSADQPRRSQFQCRSKRVAASFSAGLSESMREVHLIAARARTHATGMQMFSALALSHALGSGPGAPARELTMPARPALSCAVQSGLALAVG